MIARRHIMQTCTSSLWPEVGFLEILLPKDELILERDDKNTSGMASETEVCVINPDLIYRSSIGLWHPKMAGDRTSQSAHEQLCSSHTMSGSCWRSWSGLPLTCLGILSSLKCCRHFQRSPLQTYIIWTIWELLIYEDIIFNFSDCHPVPRILTRQSFVRGTSIPPEHPNLCFAHWGTPGPI